MAVEIANLCLAMGDFTSANPPVKNDRSVGLGTVTRVSAGLFTIPMEVPLVPSEGLVMATISGQTGSLAVQAEITSEGLITVRTKDAAGAAADGGTVQLTVWRYPTAN